MLVVWLAACATDPAPPSPEPRPVAPIPAPLARAPLADSIPGAQAMELAVVGGPGGEPSETLNLVVASRGDGEIEPCG